MALFGFHLGTHVAGAEHVFEVRCYILNKPCYRFFLLGFPIILCECKGIFISECPPCALPKIPLCWPRIDEPLVSKEVKKSGAEEAGHVTDCT